MRKSILAITALLLIFASCKRDDPCRKKTGILSDAACTNVGPEAENRLDDAQRLSIRYNNQNQLAYADSVLLDDTLVTRIQSALAAVDIAVNEANCDDLAQVSSIPVEDITSLYKFELYLDTAASWVQAWAAGNTVTGNDSIDDLFSRYNLSIDEFQDSNNQREFHFAYLKSPVPINTQILKYKFWQISGIFPIEIVANYFFPEYVSFSGDSESLEFGYIKVKSEECPDCPDSQVWDFRVNESCQVEYLGKTVTE